MGWQCGNVGNVGMAWIGVALVVRKGYTSLQDHLSQTEVENENTNRWERRKYMRARKRQNHFHTQQIHNDGLAWFFNIQCFPFVLDDIYIYIQAEAKSSREIRDRYTSPAIYAPREKIFVVVINEKTAVSMLVFKIYGRNPRKLISNE